MGKGSIQRKNYKTKQGYYNEKDYDIRLGGNFWFVVEPLNGCEDEKFFYVKLLESGMHEITGEGYIIQRKENLTNHLTKLRTELAGKTIHYFFVDDSGQVIRKET